MDYDCNTGLVLTDNMRAEPIIMNDTDMVLIDFLQVF